MYDKDDETETVGFLGSVGEDAFGETYQTMLEMEGIIPFFETIPGDTTGICLVISHKRDRAHITELGASTKISNEYFKRSFIGSYCIKRKRSIVFFLKHN
jgi:sugar/nucleoside kinase (ribokinase family)